MIDFFLKTLIILGELIVLTIIVRRFFDPVKFIIRDKPTENDSQERDEWLLRNKEIIKDKEAHMEKEKKKDERQRSHRKDA